ncbi:hypothetical protein C823_007856 [Eubacterium plexicaudatum ASF492]|uniref:Uncharacterized protein n=1 Tax=Eubacterium plexicaudatum ASF492 TaxID=1235802 RepID=N1ZZ64_9FIRM|nr:hypothetical protein C823_007856 [Eubacterium plexicaudatum ASF492]
MRKIEFYYNSDKHFCWNCMEWFKFDGNILELEECPKCHIKIQNINEVDINLNSLTRKHRNKMFDVIYNSEKVLGLHNGFDVLDAELLFELIKKLTPKKKTELFLYFEDESNTKIIDFVNNHWEYDKSLLWRETFKRLTKKKQNNFILDNFSYYINSISKRKYNWKNFKCNLIENNDVNGLYLITHTWNELGMQVYGCRLSNQHLCPCLKESTTGGAFKCFRSYLESNGLNPNTDIPFDLRKPE